MATGYTLNKFYQLAKWKKFRKKYKEKRDLIDGGKCEMCHERLGEELHHTDALKVSDLENDEITMNEDKLKWLCKKCHFGTKKNNFGNETAKADRTNIVGGTWINGDGELEKQRIIVVAGPPFGSQRTYVNKHRCEDDFILDHEAIFAAFAGRRYEVPKYLFKISCDVFDIVKQRIIARSVDAKTVWIITSKKGRQLEGFVRELNAELVECKSSYESCLARCKKIKSIKNHEFYFGIIYNWFKK